MAKKKRLALVTGGAGFIGCNLVRGLLARRWQVRVLDNFSTGKPGNLAGLEGKIEVVKGDIRRAPVCRRAMAEVTTVFHLAARPSVARSVENPTLSNEVNVTGTLNLLEAARREGTAGFVYSSSSSIYGDTPRLPKKEEMRETPMSPYAVSKMAAEKYCRVFASLYGLHTVALRYFNIYGPRQDPQSDYAAVIPKFINLIMKGRPIVIYGDGKQSRDFTYVADAVRANLLAASAKGSSGEMVNVGAGGRISLLKLVGIIAAILGEKARIEFADPRPGDVRHSLASVRHAEETIGYRPTHDIDQGLRKTVAFYKK